LQYSQRAQINITERHQFRIHFEYREIHAGSR
jgi:hypothetical protein